MDRRFKHIQTGFVRRCYMCNKALDFPGAYIEPCPEMFQLAGELWQQGRDADETTENPYFKSLKNGHVKGFADLIEEQGESL